MSSDAFLDSNKFANEAVLNGMTVFPNQSIVVEGTVSDEVEKILTGYKKHSIALEISYTDQLHAKQHRQMLRLSFDLGISAYKISDAYEVG